MKKNVYLVLFAVVMAGLGGSFTIIKIRERAINAKEKLVNSKMLQAKEAIKQFEDLQTKRKAMMRTALTTAELLEPVPRSVLLASLTNNLPDGTSLLEVKLVQKEPKGTKRVASKNKYATAQDEKTAAGTKVSPEKLLRTYIDIEGIAPSDLQVAAYIERLSSSILLNNVALVESKEHKIKTGSQRQSSTSAGPETTYRQFKLTAMLRKDVHLTKDDISKVRVDCEKSMRNF